MRRSPFLSPINPLCYSAFLCNENAAILFQSEKISQLLEKSDSKCTNFSSPSPFCRCRIASFLHTTTVLLHGAKRNASFSRTRVVVAEKQNNGEFGSARASLISAAIANAPFFPRVNEPFRKNALREKSSLLEKRIGKFFQSHQRCLKRGLFSGKSFRKVLPFIPSPTSSGVLRKEEVKGEINFRLALIGLGKREEGGGGIQLFEIGSAG